MKIIFYALIFILLIAFISGAIFVLTFDINRYKDDIANRISRQLGCPIQIGSLSLSLHRGLALQASNVSLVYELTVPPARFELTTQNFFLKLQLKPLLQKRLEVSEIIIDQPVALYESKTEQVQLIPIKSTAPIPVSHEKEVFDRAVEKQKEAAQKSVDHLSQFEVKAIHLERGQFTYRDQNRRVPFEFTVTDILFDVRNLSIAETVEFSGSLGIDFAGMKKLFFNGNFSYSEQVLKLEGNFENSAKLIAKVTDALKTPEVRVDIGIEKLDFSSFYTPEQKIGEHLSGFLSGNVSLSSHGTNGFDALRSLSGIGKIRLEQGALRNRNLLRESLEKITQIPGLNAISQSDLGERFNQLLASPDTQFDQIASNFQVAHLRLGIEFLSLIHPDYRANSNGSIGFDKSLDLTGSIEIGRELSEALIHKVKELVYISNSQSEIAIPFTYKGYFPQAVFLPNVGTIATQAIQNVGADLLNEALNKLLKPKEDAAQSAPSN